MEFVVGSVVMRVTTSDRVLSNLTSLELSFITDND